jgi:hypothetical protein
MFMLYTVAGMNDSVKKPLEVIRNVPSIYWTIDVKYRKVSIETLSTNLISFHLIVETFDGRNSDRFSNINILWIEIFFHYTTSYTWSK